ncbi:LacI family DNA-binding transcriptional regulator [Streptomyces sp. NPDC047000]|uniref:LacI family DNA-binding transcriptional regulator n=1 Tax=Streptomyces sp. NPDC047000 TaxID=3155474 RepID=UPI003411D96F
MIKLDDVARASGVSISTVSRALSEPERVAEPTRRRIYAAVRELGYRPNRAASLLRSGRTGSLGLLVPDLENPYFASLTKGVQARAQEAGMAVLVADSDENLRRETDLVGQLAQQTDGVLVASPRILDLDVAALDGTPSILINAEAPGLPSVSVDYADATMQAVAHLHALGHRRIAYAGGPAGSSADARRRDGLTQADERFSDVQIVDLGAFSPRVEGGEAAADLAVGSGATGIIAFNDLVAVGLLALLARRGIAVPDQLSVVGYDDILVSRLATPTLTTMRVDIRGVGEAAVQMFVDLTGRRPKTRADAADERRTMPTRLVVRESTAAPVQRG